MLIMRACPQTLADGHILVQEILSTKSFLELELSGSNCFAQLGTSGAASASL